MSKALKLGCAFVLFTFLSTGAAFAQTHTGILLYQMDGAAAGDRMGWAVAPAGDVNGDGRDDFIAGAYFADPGGVVNAGAGYVYSGADGSLLYRKDGAAAGDLMANVVAPAGDVNADGRSDFIFGAYAADPGGRDRAGSAYVYSGADGSLLYQHDGAAAGDILAISVASAGDVNGDGRPDYILGAYTTDPGGVSNAGSAYVYSGADGSLIYQKDGAAAEDFLGNSVASAGDVNADGRADFIIGAYGADPGGLSAAASAYVYSGMDGSLLYQKNGAAAGDRLGFSVATTGDVNADGRSDFIIGAYEADPNGLVDAGSAYVYSGLDGSLLYQKDGLAAFDNLGNYVASAGDIDGDGRLDFMIAAFRADPDGLVDAGSAYVYSGTDGSLLFQKDGAAGDQLGYVISSAGDIDGNGRDDFIIGAFRADPGGLLNAGSAYVYSFCLAARGDLNDDGTIAPADVVALLYCLLPGSGNCDLCSADENCDGAVSAADVTLEINRVFLGAPFICQL